MEGVPAHDPVDGSATPAGVVALAQGIRGCRRCAPRPRLMADIAPRCSWRIDRFESNEMRAIRTWRLPVVLGREETRGVLAVGQPYDESTAFSITARRLKNLQHQAKALNMTLVPA